MARGSGTGLLAFVAFSAFGAKAQATNGLFCQGTLSYPEGTYVCVGSQASADYVKSVVSLGLGPDRMDSGPASTGEVATSSFGAASAEASARVGQLSGKTHAEVLTKMPLAEQDPNWTCGGLASAAFHDTVVIQGQPGVPLGTPVTAHLRTKVQGAFSGATEKGVLGAEADFTGQVHLIHGAGGQTELQVPSLSNVFWSYQGHTGEASDTLLPNVKTGDSLDIHWALRIESFVNQVTTLPQTDSEIVAQLFLDLEPTIAIAVGQTAYDYRGDGEAGAGGEGGVGGEGGASDEPAGEAGRNEDAMGGASDSVGSAGEGGEAAVGGRAGTGGAPAGRGGAGQPPQDSSGCSLSSTSPSQNPLPFAFALGSVLVAFVRRRRGRRVNVT